jgi:cell wall-associated NlpC family hydrolase
LCDDNLLVSSRKNSCSSCSTDSAEFAFLRLSLMTHTSHIAPHRRLARNLRNALVATAVSAGALSVFGAGEVSAAEPLPVNAMATEVSQAATRALTDYDKFLALGDDALYRSYAFHRAQTARFAAIELGYSEDAMADAWASAPIGHQRAVLSAMTQVGVPYRRNTSIEGVGFDCSGLTTFAWAEPGVTLFRQSGSQISKASKLDRSTARAGDLVHYPGHIMVYLGVDDAIIHSVQTGRTVELDTISARRTNSVSWGDPTT